MATSKQVTAPAQPAEGKKEYWGEERNARRRKRYADDPQYRADVLQRARQTQFQKRREAGMEVREDEDCRDNLGKLGSFEKRAIHLGETEFGTDRAVTAEDLAMLLNRNPQVLYRWMGTGMLPRPLFEIYNDRNRKQAVYLNDEARAILTVFGEHQQTSLYYRASHVDTINRIHRAVGAVRQKHGVNNANSKQATRH
jgi:hypothetical protein